MTDDVTAVESLERLGLANYEARVFVALQKLGRGTAKQIHEVSGVPRSQVYGAAETLEEQGLVEVQRSSPITYRPVDLDEARARLEARFERDQERAFDYLAEVREEQEADEEREDIWTVSGRASVEARTEQLIHEATDVVVFGATEEPFISEGIEEALRERAAADVTVTVLSVDPVVRERFADADIPVISPVGQEENERAGRMLFVDDDTVLVSVRGPEETAIWSSGTGLATVLIQLIRGAMAGAFEE